MSRLARSSSRMVTPLRWPVGLAWTSFVYTWRIVPVKRREIEGSWPQDAPPELGPGVSRDKVQRQEDGVGKLMRRRYRVRVAGANVTAAELMAEVAGEPNVLSPGALAHFFKTKGEQGTMAVGDEFRIRMPGPWDGPVRVGELTPTSFRFLTLEGHIEAGQIEWRARDEDGRLVFEIESWSRPGDTVSALMHHGLRMAKEVQLHMWTTVLERVVTHVEGRRDGPLDIETRIVGDAPGG